MGHVLLSVAEVAVDAVGFAECVVQCRVERTGRDLRAKLGNRLRQLQCTGYFGGSLQVLRFEFVIDVDGVRRQIVAPRNAADLLCQQLHRFQRLIVGDLLVKKRPGVA